MKTIIYLIILGLNLIFNINSIAQTIGDWELQSTPTNDFLWGIQFLDNQNGWAIGNNTILNTSNGGETWVAQQINNGNHYLKEIFFTDQLNGWAVGGYYYNNPYGGIFHTSDGGQTWNLQFESAQWDFSGLYFLDNMRGWVVGGYSNISGPVILYTNNGGNSWEIQYSDITQTFSIFDISFYDETIGWAAGSDGKILFTNNGGTSWNHQDTYTFYYIRNIQALTNTDAYACGSMGLFLFTHDGGNNWHHIPPTTYFDVNNLNGLHFLNNQVGWIVGDVGSIYYTMDGGITWTYLDFGFWEYFHDIYFSDQNNGWIVGMDGLIYHTNNSGGLITSTGDFKNIKNNLSISPNPFQNQFELDFKIVSKERIQISIFDIQGNQIKLINDQIYEPGDYSLIVENLENIPIGIYILEIKSDSQIASTKLMKI